MKGGEKMNVVGMLMNTVDISSEGISSKTENIKDRRFHQILAGVGDEMKSPKEEITQKSIKQVPNISIEVEGKDLNLKFNELNKKLIKLIDYLNEEPALVTKQSNNLKTEITLLRDQFTDLIQQINMYQAEKWKLSDLNSSNFNSLPTIDEPLELLSEENFQSQLNVLNPLNDALFDANLDNELSKPFIHKEIKSNLKNLINFMDTILGKLENDTKPTNQLDTNGIDARLLSNNDIESNNPKIQMLNLNDVIKVDFVNERLFVSKSNTHSVATSNNLNSNEVEKRLIEIISDVKQILSYENVATNNSKEIAPKLLLLLKEWSKLTKVLEENQTLKSMLNSLDDKSIKSKRIWIDLLQNYQRRMEVNNRLGNLVETNITTKEVANWLDKALERHIPNDKLTTTNVNLHTATPMSRLEQYVIHVSQTQGKKSSNESFMNQFKQVIKSSTFSNSPNGMTQLSIKLQPVHLGEIMVRLNQSNGEMTVRMIVTSQSAKELLESNIHQLKNLFSPHQVVIEKQESIQQQSAQTFKEEGNQEGEEKQHDEPDHSNQRNKDSDQEENQKTFRDWLMNEKV